MVPYPPATVVYPCPRCGIGLRARAVARPNWLRCPQCGKGGMPPFPTRTRTPIVSSQVAYDPDILVIGEEVMLEPETPWYGSTRPQPVAPAMAPATERPVARPNRTGLAILFSLCLSLFFVLLAIDEAFKAGLFGVAAGVLLLFLVRPKRTVTRP